MFQKRLKILTIGIFLCFFIVILRLFYWQIIKSADFKLKGIMQTYKLEKIYPERGKIFSSDNFPIALNKNEYQISIYKPNLKNSLENIIKKIDSIKPNFIQDNQDLLNNFQNNSNQKWITLPSKFTETEIKQINFPGISTTKASNRLYSEEPFFQNIIGKIGKNSQGSNIGYDGLEGFYNKQLSGKMGFVWSSKDATGKTILSKKTWASETVNGRDLYTFINRNIQYQVESKLQAGLKDFSADSGSIIIMEPTSGAILAMASLTATNSATMSATKNSAISDLFEPGSIFKPLIMASALDKKSLNTDFICFGCNKPRQIGKYTISNWDSEIHPDSNLKDIIKNSDNIGMSFVIDKLGLNNFLEYYKKMGFTQKTGIDLQGEAKPLLKENWPDIDLATASFGQGIAITQIQMIQAFNSIANNGFLVKPKIVNYFFEKNKIIKTKEKEKTKVFNKETTDEIKSILKYAVENGVVSKFKPENLEVCAKSGTAQIAIKGGYTDSSTIASYIGFSPCDNPKFTMIVTINNPKTSPWGSSTAAPIWFDLASTISHLL